ncbi:MAG TPA: hypothetical protein DCF45_02250 [Gammaproteobacteria bacterium]|nr:hypothetical protein [Gammaproteobacteria bacterium]
MFKPILAIPALTLLAVTPCWLPGDGVAAGECDPPRPEHWLFCDDFSQSPDASRYFQYSDGDGSFRWSESAGIGARHLVGDRGEDGAMVARWRTGQVDAGSLKLLIGDNPLSELAIDTAGRQLREIYYRHYFRLSPGWNGNPHKLSRATILVDRNWSQAMIAHLWGGRDQRLVVDPVSCVLRGGREPVCRGYNDFPNMRWLGKAAGVTPVHTMEQADQWHCVEAAVSLNDQGFANGYQEFWLNGEPEAAAIGLDFVGDYRGYGINALFIENWWNGGAPGERSRVIDNLVVATGRIGCLLEGR